MAANQGTWYQESAQQQEKESAVIELGTIDDDDSSTADSDGFSTRKKALDSETDEEMGESTGQFIGTTAANLMWQAGKQQAQKAFNIYGNIDILRPYFDVEPKEVVNRLIHAFIPQKVTTKPQKVAGELYGPLMVVFTLVAIILMGMKSSGHTVREGTLMGTAFGICFGYWILGSALIYTIVYVCNTHITMLQVLSLTGYGLTSHCIVLLLTTVLHSTESHLLFYFLWLSVGGMAALKMVTIYVSRTHGKSQKLVIAGVIVALHLLFLLYLHFSYHKIAENVMVHRPHSIIQVDPPQIPDRLERDTRVQEKVQNAAQEVLEEAVKSVNKAAQHVGEAVQEKLKENADNNGNVVEQIKDTAEKIQEVANDAIGNDPDLDPVVVNPPVDIANQ